MLLLVAIIGLGIALFITRQDLAEAKRQLSVSQPLSLSEVARQFQKNASTSTVAVTVNDVRYSDVEKAYKVEFLWVDPTTKQKWSSETKLQSDGFGRYLGQVRSSEFLTALGSSGFITVFVETPSAFK
jgi:hypothetical protein